MQQISALRIFHIIFLLVQTSPRVRHSLSHANRRTSKPTENRRRSFSLASVECLYNTTAVSAIPFLLDTILASELQYRLSVDRSLEFLWFFGGKVLPTNLGHCAATSVLVCRCKHATCPSRQRRELRTFSTSRQRQGYSPASIGIQKRCKVYAALNGYGCSIGHIGHVEQWRLDRIIKSWEPDQER